MPGHKVLTPRALRLLQCLGERPGLNLDELAAVLVVQRTAAKHHLQRLERLGLVSRIRQGRHVLHFLGTTPVFERDLVRLLRVPSIHQVVTVLFHHPETSPAALAHKLAISERTVRRALAQLRRSGVLHVERIPGGKRTHLHPDLRVLLVRHAFLAEMPDPAAPPPRGDIP